MREFILLLQSALQPLWGLSCPTIVEYSQQEDFYSLISSAKMHTDRNPKAIKKDINQDHRA